MSEHPARQSPCPTRRGLFGRWLRVEKLSLGEVKPGRIASLPRVTPEPSIRTLNYKERRKWYRRSMSPERRSHTAPTAERPQVTSLGIITEKPAQPSDQRESNHI